MRRFAVLALAATLLTACVGPVPAATGVVGVDGALDASVSGRLLYVRNGAIEEIGDTGDREIVKGDAQRGDFMTPAWSPDGKQIAYAVRHKNYSDVGFMNADGSNQTLLTHDSSTVVENNLWATAPAWSPDGKALVYSTDQGKQEPNIDLRLWQLTLATRGLANLTIPDLQAGGDADASYRPGHPGQLIYTRWAYDPNATTVYSSLVLLDLNTREHFALTSSKDTDFQPAWSPDGKYVAFIRRGAGTDDLYVASVPDTLTNDTTINATLVEAGVNAQPCWSPDGSELAYIAENNNQFDLYRVAVSTTPSIAAKGKPVQLTNNGVDASSRPSWTK